MIQKINLNQNKKYLLIAFFSVLSASGLAQVKPIEENPAGILKGLQYEIDMRFLTFVIINDPKGLCIFK